MEPGVDSGSIFEVERFPIAPEDGLAELQEKTKETLFRILRRTLRGLSKCEELKPTGIQWGKTMYTRKKLNALCRVTADMDKEEVHKRIKANHHPAYPQFEAYVEVDGVKFFARPHAQPGTQPA